MQWLWVIIGSVCWVTVLAEISNEWGALNQAIDDTDNLQRLLLATMSEEDVIVYNEMVNEDEDERFNLSVTCSLCKVSSSGWGVVVEGGR